jgi:hypothetical protein
MARERMAITLSDLALAGFLTMHPLEVLDSYSPPGTPRPRLMHAITDRHTDFGTCIS